MRAIMSNEFDLLLLDMSMPVYDVTAHDTGGRPLPLAGRDILFQLKRKRNLLKAIVVTQYEDFNGVSLQKLDLTLREEFPLNYLGYVYYNITQDNWRRNLETMLQNIIREES
jgi:CheY-like chemotaxis protein